MGEISAFIIGGIVGIVTASVGLQEVTRIVKEMLTKAVPVFLGLLGV